MSPDELRSTLQAALASRRYRMHVEAPGLDPGEMTLGCRDQLSVHVRVTALGQRSEVDLAPLFLHFLFTDKDEAAYVDKARITVEKFGSPIQFEENLHVRFWRTR